MKSYIKQIAFVSFVTALFFASQGFAQNPEDSRATRFGIGLSLGLATNNTYRSVIGGDVRLQKDFASNASGIMSVGYTSFSIKSGSPGQSYNVIPVKIGLKIFPVERFYFSGEIGSGLAAKTGNRTTFVYSPGLGIGFNMGLDLGLRYEAFTSKVYNNPSQVAVRIAYGFKMGKK
jgi:hypothetical protein